MLASLVAGTLLLSMLLCFAYLQLARRWQIVDRPNARSAHELPTPRGGGIAIVLAWIVALLAGTFWYGAGEAPLGMLLTAAFILVVAGWWDDVTALPVATRLGVYAVVCAGAVMQLPLQSPWLWPLAWLYLLWLCNLYNFMDGIDGIAGLQTVFVCAAGAALGSFTGAPLWHLMAALTLAAACCGFLVFNWPRASLFMGDSGSITLGFLLGVLSLSAEPQAGLPLASWLILLAAFVADSSYTLLRRWSTGKSVTQAHNQHLYQRLARRWGSHEKVLWALMLINLLWLLPLASVAALWPGWNMIVAVLAYLPLIAIMWKAGKIT
jgi:Fuc2NAc and GlcNAc transferase